MLDGLCREYRGIGGNTKNLETDPRPCLLCLVKIINLAQVGTGTEVLIAGEVLEFLAGLGGSGSDSSLFVAAPDLSPFRGF